jgi:NAD(P)-dependent dehydrogenase (short-subunit alcohol dehydrogenase family)
MAETIALVTGANKGIGKEISRQLSAKGILVLMGARDRERGELAVADLRAQGVAVEFIPIDVTSQSSVDHAAAEVERRHGRLDMLVNNAGVALDWFPGSELSVDMLQKTFETNVFGVFRVTKALLPLLRKSKHVELSICRADWAPSLGMPTPTSRCRVRTCCWRTVRRKLPSI